MTPGNDKYMHIATTYDICRLQCACREVESHPKKAILGFDGLHGSTSIDVGKHLGMAEGSVSDCSVSDLSYFLCDLAIPMLTRPG
jgi:hypothetical protein